MRSFWLGEGFLGETTPTQSTRGRKRAPEGSAGRGTGREHSSAEEVLIGGTGDRRLQNKRSRWPRDGLRPPPGLAPPPPRFQCCEERRARRPGAKRSVYFATVLDPLTPTLTSGVRGTGCGGGTRPRLPRAQPARRRAHRKKGGFILQSPVPCTTLPHPLFCLPSSSLVPGGRSSRPRPRPGPGPGPGLARAQASAKAY